MIHSFYLLLAVAIWGGNAVVTKASAGLIGPAEITFWRWLAALAVMAPFVLPALLRQRRLRWRHVWRLWVMGALGGGGFSILTYFAALHTSALNIGLIQALMPLLALVLAMVVLGQRLTAGAVAGGLVGLSGVALVVSGGKPWLLLSQAPNLGDALMIVAVLCYAVYSVLLKRWPVPVTPFQSLFVQNIASVAVMVPLWLAMPRQGLDAGNIGLVLYAGILASLAAPLCWMLGIAAIGPARASMFFNLVPVVAAVLAVALLGERLTLPLLAGGGLTIGGVILAERWRRPLRPAPAFD